MVVRVHLLGLAALAVAGCYAEASTGLYRVSNGYQQSGPAYEFGIAAGVYVDPRPVHIGIGVGGENAWADYDNDEVPPAQVRHSTTRGINAQLGAHLYDFDEIGQRSLWLYSGFSVSTDDAVEIEIADPNLEDFEFDGRAYAFYLAPQLKFWWGPTERVGIGLWLSAGPSVIYSDADHFGGTTLTGFQIRYAVYGIPTPKRYGGLATLFRHSGYQSGLDQALHQHNTNMGHHHEAACARDPSCRLERR